MLFSSVKISCFRAKAHLVFYWRLYNNHLSLPHLKALKTNKLAVAVGYEVRAKMWVYFGDVIDENRFHNFVGESEKALLVPVSTKDHWGSWTWKVNWTTLYTTVRVKDGRTLRNGIIKRNVQYSVWKMAQRNKLKRKARARLCRAFFAPNLKVGTLCRSLYYCLLNSTKNACWTWSRPSYNSRDF